MLRRTSSLLASFAVLASLGVAATVAAVPAVAAQAVSVSATAVPSAPDFATTAYSDPWDFSDAADLNPNPGLAVHGTSAVTYTPVTANFSAARGGFVQLVTGVSGSLALGRDGRVTPIPAASYTRASVRIYSSVADSAQLYWFTCIEQSSACLGAAGFSLRAGWNLVDIPLVASPGTTPWAGSIQALWLLPAVAAAGSFQLDFVRIYRPSPADQITVQRSADGGYGQVVLDPDTTPDNGNEAVLGSINGTSARVDLSGLGDGAWHIAVRDYAGTTYAPTPVTVDSGPLPVVDDPSASGGADYATTVRHDPWDFSQASDVAGLVDVQNASYTYGVLHAQNGPPLQNDPEVILSQPGPFDGSTYHRMTLHVGYDGGFSGEDVVGGGMVGRVVWKVAGSASWQVSDDIVVSPGDQTIVVDLATSPSAAITDPASSPRIGWAGQQITTVRWDPEEDRGARSWRVDGITLAADDQGGSSYDVRFHAGSYRPGTVADLYADTDGAGYDGRLIASGIAVQPGVTTYHWDARSVGAGTYRIYVVMRGPVASGRAYASGPVRVSPPSTFGSFDIARQVAGGVSLSGWAVDPDAGSGAVSSVRAYVDGVAGVGGPALAPRADVAAAFGYGANHGFNLLTGALSEGNHSICVHASSTGAPDTLLGCRTVVFSSNGFGSFDTTRRAPGGVRVSGWEIDRSTTRSTTVHAYVDGRFAAAFPATSSRPDVAAVYPGYGTAHGFVGVVPVAAGAHTLCLYGLDAVAPGVSVLLSCRGVTVSADPFGSYDIAHRTAAGVVTGGWAIDPDTSSPDAVHVYVDGRFATAVTADTARSDIAQLFPDYGPAHGFSTPVIPLSAGTHTVCTYGVNVSGAGGSVLLGCRAV